MHTVCAACVAIQSAEYRFRFRSKIDRVSFWVNIDWFHIDFWLFSFGHSLALMRDRTRSLYIFGMHQIALNVHKNYIIFSARSASQSESDPWIARPELRDNHNHNHNKKKINHTFWLAYFNWDKFIKFNFICGSNGPTPRDTCTHSTIYPLSCGCMG